MSITWVQTFRKGLGMGSEYIEEQATIIDALSAAADGEWWNARGLVSLSMEITGLTTGTVKIGTSFALTIPANTADGTDVDSQTAVGIDGYHANVFGSWIKVHLHAWTEGATTVKVIRRRHVGV